MIIRSYPPKISRIWYSTLWQGHTEIYIPLDAVSHFSVLIYLAALAQSWVSDDWATVSEAALSEAAVATSWMILEVKHGQTVTLLWHSLKMSYIIGLCLSEGSMLLVLLVLFWLFWNSEQSMFNARLSSVVHSDNHLGNCCCQTLWIQKLLVAFEFAAKRHINARQTMHLPSHSPAPAPHMHARDHTVVNQPVVSIYSVRLLACLTYESLGSSDRNLPRKILKEAGHPSCGLERFSLNTNTPWKVMKTMELRLTDTNLRRLWSEAELVKLGFLQPSRFKRCRSWLC